MNVYRQHDVVPAAAASPATEAAVKRIVDHAHFLTSEPAEAELLLDFLAYVYQNPGKRVRWAILLFGIQGNGNAGPLKSDKLKSTIFTRTIFCLLLI